MVAKFHCTTFAFAKPSLRRTGRPYYPRALPCESKSRGKDKRFRTGSNRECISLRKIACAPYPGTLHFMPTRARPESSIYSPFRVDPPPRFRARFGGVMDKFYRTNTTRMGFPSPHPPRCCLLPRCASSTSTMSCSSGDQ